MTKSLQLRNVEKHFGAFHVLRDISLDVEEGEFIVMVGPSGCGKSTLLRTIAGLEPISAGLMSIAGRDVTGLEPVDRGISMVFQSYALYPHMTVAENMSFGLRMAKRPARRSMPRSSAPRRSCASLINSTRSPSTSREGSASV